MIYLIDSSEIKENNGRNIINKNNVAEYISKNSKKLEITRKEECRKTNRVDNLHQC